MLRWRYLKLSFGWWFGLIWAFVGTTFAIVGVATWVDQRKFNDAVAARATVVEKGHGSDSDGDSKYWMRYLYHDAAGAEHVEVADVGWTLWRKYEDGDALPILYLPHNADRSRIEDEDAQSPWVLPLIFTGIGSIFGGIGWFLAVKSLRSSGRRARLLKSGMGALGRVTAVEMNMNVKINNRHPYYLTYEFTDDGGTRREGRSPNLPRRLNDRWQAGDPILVAYDAFDPERHEVDLFDVRAEEFEMLARRAGTRQ